MTDLGLDNFLVLDGIPGGIQPTVARLLTQLAEVLQKLIRVESQKDGMEVRLADVRETLVSQQHKFEAHVADLYARFDARLETAVREAVEVTRSQLDTKHKNKTETHISKLQNLKVNFKFEP